MSSSFNGKVALVTGGGSGLGESIARLLASRGASVVITDINLAAADKVAGEIKAAGGKASTLKQDTAKAADSEAAVKHAVATFGALHYAVNNAGIGGAAAPTGEVDLTDWDRVIDINLNGVLYGMRYQIPAMLEAATRWAASARRRKLQQWWRSCSRTRRRSSPGDTTWWMVGILLCEK